MISYALHRSNPPFVALQFSEMSKLEILWIVGVDITTEIIESMILDNTTFPNLKFLGMCEVFGDYDVRRIKEIARIKNLDFQINDVNMNQYRENNSH